MAAVAALPFLMWKARGNTFFYDEWTWITTRGSGLHAIVASYNNHMLPAPIALYQLLFHTVGLKQFWVYRLLGTVAHISCVSLVWLYARQRVGALALALVLPLLVLGYGWEYVLWPINIGFIASLAFGTGALLVLDRASPRADALASLLLIAGLVCSEFALVFALAVAVELLWRPQRLRRAYVWALPFIIYAGWWLGYHEPSRAANLLSAPSFMLDLAAAATGGLFGLPITWGRLLLLGGGLLTIRHLIGFRPPPPRAWGLVLAAVAFWLLVAAGRAQLGQANAPRYIYTGSILLVLVLSEVWRGVQPSPGNLWVIAVVILVAVVGNIGQLRIGQQHLRLASHTARAELGALQLAGPVAADFVIDRSYMPGVTAGRYQAAVDRFGPPAVDTPRQIPEEGGAPAAAADRLLIRGGNLRIRYEDAPGGCPAPAPAPRGATTRRLPTSGVQLQAPRAGTLKVSVRRFADRFSVPVAGISNGAWLSIVPRPDAAAVPWVVRLTATAPASICSVR